jgi:VanZ family protein
LSLVPSHLRLAFWLALTVWSWLLVKPQPFPELSQQLFDWYALLPFLAAKSLHMTGYAALAVLAAAGWPARRRWWMVLLVVVHGPLSELAQHLGNLWFDTKRSGCVRDVIVDWVGVAAGLGVWLGWRRVRRPSPVDSPATEFTSTPSA